MTVLLCIDTEKGRVRRYVPTRLLGMRMREAGEVSFQPWAPHMKLEQKTIDALEHWRKEGTLQ